jgi:para-aminobenzoate synthetase component 1
MSFDDMILGLYDTVFAFDHLEKKAFIFSSGFPETNHDKRKIRAEQRLDELLLQLNHRAVAECFMPLTKDDFHSSFTQNSYCQAVEQVIDYILAGDIFEANISQRFSANIPKHYSAFELYKRLRVLNPASFSAYLNFSPINLVSASPERFLKVIKGKVETRPIKGTRPRGDTAAHDKALADELTHSEKDHAENVMIVDLMRNDLSKVCEPHSVKVTQLCGLESFASVHHLVSVISATLKPKLSAIDLLKATFPGGSITGAPKIRSMEIISEIEPTHRGPYCGCIGYLSWAGDMDTSITIRTIAINNDALSFQVGGAIVADSNPAEEFAETLTKGQSLLKALTEIT